MKVWKNEKMWILHGWSWCRLGWLPVKEQLRNGAVGLTLRYLGHAGTVSHMFLAQPTHSTTATFPWSAIHGPNYIFHHRIFCRAFSKMPDPRWVHQRCLLFPTPCLLKTSSQLWSAIFEWSLDPGVGIGEFDFMIPPYQVGLSQRWPIGDSDSG